MRDEDKQEYLDLRSVEAGGERPCPAPIRSGARCQREVILGVLDHELKRQLAESIEGQFTMAKDLDWGEMADAIGVRLGLCTVRGDFNGGPQTIEWNER